MLCYLPPLPAWNSINRLRHLCHDTTLPLIPPCLRVAHPCPFGEFEEGTGGVTGVEDGDIEVVVVGASIAKRRGYTVLYLEVNDGVKDLVLGVRRSYMSGKPPPPHSPAPAGGKKGSAPLDDGDKFVPSLILGHFTCSEEAEVYRSAVEMELSSMGGLRFSPEKLALLHRHSEHKPFKLLQTRGAGGGGKEGVRWYDIEGDDGEMEDMPPDVEKGTASNKKKKKKTWGN
ncbi:hypothetical protein TrRE_jg13156 [Triparma retinervis]|uniref:Uncharacterized protein n=1 Tax=Triparma retinervis TaxID=2557542 RepID=A0A9W7DPI6_9STRA|nr:hypothetical protein TrRE_jg13156 [Triparma retinervis]